MEKKRILFYNSTLLRGGTESYILGLIQNLSKDRFDVDLIIKNGDIIDDYYYGELKKVCNNIYLAKGSFFKRIMFLRKFFKTNAGVYDVVHINATSQGAGLISYFAKKIGKAKKVIFHSHMSGNDNKFDMVDRVGNKLLKKYSTDFVACSNLAAEFMFGSEFVKQNKITIFRNSVDTQKFTFNKNIREKLRTSFNLKEDDLVLLHVGRFVPQKNHKFLINVFNEVVKEKPNSYLLLIGEGELLKETKSQVAELGLELNVKFLGLKENVNEFMMMADVFVMPSVHEGLPVVAVEAQSTGLSVVFSKNITTEAKLIDNVKFIGLDESYQIWATEILRIKNNDRHEMSAELKSEGYESHSAAKIVEEFYLKWENMERGKISVIVPVYKVEKYLERCIRSILRQTYKNLEIILIDDGSPDNCPAICDKLAEEDKRVRVFHIKNQGVSNARNVGLENASGEFVTFVDSDDRIDSTMYEKLIKKQVETNADLVFSRYLYEDENTHEITKVDERRLQDFCESGDLKYFYNHTSNNDKNGDKIVITESVMCNIWRVLFKREVVEDVRFNLGIKFMEDVVFLSEILAKKDKKIAFIDEYLYYYLLRESSAVRTRAKIIYQNSLAYLSAIKKVLVESEFEKHLPALEYFCYSECVLAKVVFGENIDLKKIKSWGSKENYKANKTLTFGLKQKVKYFLIRHKMFWLLKFLYKVKWLWRK